MQLVSSSQCAVGGSCAAALGEEEGNPPSIQCKCVIYFNIGKSWIKADSEMTDVWMATCVHPPFQSVSFLRKKRMYLLPTTES